MKIIRLENKNNKIFEKICEWNYNWWGSKNGETLDDIKTYFEHSLHRDEKLPQTFVALEGDMPVGMYSICMCDDLYNRPDIYPLFANLYVDEKHRGRGIGKKLIINAKENARKAGITELYLYTEHKEIFEKYGWKYIESVDTFRKDLPTARLYKLNIN